MTNLPFQPAYPFEAILQTDGRLHLSGVPDDEKIINQIVQALAQTQPFGEAWDADYRTLYLLSGASVTPVTTREEVQAIPVPHWRRLRGELSGNQLTLAERETSTNGEHWTPYPTFNDTREAEKHPAFELPGETIGQFFTLHWREGRIDIEPDPPEELLESLENVVQSLNGGDETAWKAQHAALGGDPKVNPEAKRGSIEIRKLSPLFGPSQQPFARYPGTEFWPLVPLEYSLDGKKWESYALAQAPQLPLTEGSEDEEDDENDPFGLLSQLFDLQTAAVTVHADGKVEWDEDDIPAEHADALRQSMLAATGAGDPAVWAERTTELLPEGVEGTPTAVQFQVMKQLLDSAAGMLDQSYAPSALTVDGAEWHDLTPPMFEE